MTILSDDIRQLIQTDYLSARPLLHDLVAQLPDSVEARTLLALSYLRVLETEPAIAHYRAAQRLDPHDLDIRQQIGLCALNMGNYAAALEVFREAMPLGPPELSSAMAALMLHRLGRVEESISVYAGCLSTLKRDHDEAVHLLRGMAMAMRDVGAVVAAERFMHEAIQLYVRDPVEVATALIVRDRATDFHDWTWVGHKIDLARALARTRGKRNAPHHPETYVLPEDRAALLEDAKHVQGACYIAKPHRGTGGRGISITRDVSTLAERTDVLAQRYIERPYLVDGRKGHIRLYGLVTSVNPLRAYLYREGIVRFAPEPYDLSGDGIANVHGHVTNTALHRGHTALEVSQDPSHEDVGHVWTLSAYLKRIKADGLDVAVVRKAFRQLTKNFLDMLHAEGLFQRQAAAGPSRSFGFKLFGLDVLLDADGQPWLIEAERMPEILGPPLVGRIHGAMFRTVFEMSCGLLLDDAMPADQVAAIAKDPAALARREAEHEFTCRGLFEPLTTNMKRRQEPEARRRTSVTAS